MLTSRINNYFNMSLTDLRDCGKPFDTVARGDAGYDVRWYELRDSAYDVLSSYVNYDSGTESLYHHGTSLEQYMFLCFVIEAEATKDQE